MRNQILLVICWFVVQPMTTTATIRLPSVISGNMVLQQQSTCKLWGWADPAEKIFITTSWDNRTDSVVATGDARWEIALRTPSAGGPYKITLRGWNTIVLDDILIGEVWICSGQSNMEWSSNQNLKQIMDELPHSLNKNIRLFHISKTTSTAPQDDAPGKWKVCDPESLKGFSAIGYFFAKKLQQDLNVPIGIINSSWGGTPAETWTPQEDVAKDPQLKKAAGQLQPAAWWPIKEGLAYNAMIAPITDFTIAGAIWYQGESNTTTAASYQSLFTAMIGSWRKAWNKEFPFYYVQIAPFEYGNMHIGALLREQQTRSLSVPKTGMVVISDLVDNVKDIHPTNKKDVADRLANLALADTYGKPLAGFRSPLFNRMELQKDKAVLFFDNAPNGFQLKGGSRATEFYIAGDDKQFVPADVKLEKDRIIVYHKNVKQPAAVRFGFGNASIGNVFSKEGLPVGPFRTDDWEVDTDKIDQTKK